jgi:hypothetical protein
MLICDSSAHDGGGVNVVESAILVEGWTRVAGSAWGVWRTWRLFGDISAFVRLGIIKPTAQPALEGLQVLINTKLTRPGM